MGTSGGWSEGAPSSSVTTLCSGSWRAMPTPASKRPVSSMCAWVERPSRPGGRRRSCRGKQLRWRTRWPACAPSSAAPAASRRPRRRPRPHHPRPRPWRRRRRRLRRHPQRRPAVPRPMCRTARRRRSWRPMLAPAPRQASTSIPWHGSRDAVATTCRLGVARSTASTPGRCCWLTGTSALQSRVARLAWRLCSAPGRSPASCRRRPPARPRPQPPPRSEAASPEAQARRRGRRLCQRRPGRGFAALPKRSLHEVARAKLRSTRNTGGLWEAPDSYQKRGTHADDDDGRG
mmetsp:Transcript_176626/g.566342  ORF Transcript_176626/g.566342 Transcript_176626/m.566342 type:complete len:290 (+) Transcript_176626:814-1683(+)